MMTNIEILKGMRQLLDKPESWHQGWYSADEKGDPCSLQDGCRFCIAGALIKTGNGLSCIIDVTNLISGKVGNMSIWNDAKERTHADVIQLLDEMIAEQNV